MQQVSPKPVSQKRLIRWVLAGLVMGAAAGTDYETLLSKRILIPLGMKDTELERLDQFIRKRTYSYEMANGTPIRSRGGGTSIRLVLRAECILQSATSSDGPMPSSTPTPCCLSRYAGSFCLRKKGIIMDLSAAR